MKETSLRKIKAAIISAAIVGAAINERSDKSVNSEMQQRVDEESSESSISMHSPLSFVENLGC